MGTAALDTHVTCFTIASEYTYFALRLQDAFLVTIWLGKPQDNGRAKKTPAVKIFAPLTALQLSPLAALCATAHVNGYPRQYSVVCAVLSNMSKPCLPQSGTKRGGNFVLTEAFFDRICRIDRIENLLPQRTHRTHRKEICPDEGNKAFRICSLRSLCSLWLTLIKLLVND